MADKLDIILKLFDVIILETKNNGTSLNTMIAQQEKLISYVEHLPMTDLTTTLRTHDKESKDKVTSCEETVKTQSATVEKKVDQVNNRIGKMITIVIVVVSLFSAALLFGTLARDRLIPPEGPTTQEMQETIQDLKDEIQRLHKDDTSVIEQN